MAISTEIYIDALFAVTDMGAYEEYNNSHPQFPKDIKYFKRQIFYGDFLDISQSEDGFTLLSINEEGESKQIKILESIEEIQHVIMTIEKMNKDEDIVHYLYKKMKEIGKKI